MSTRTIGYLISAFLLLSLPFLAIAQDLPDTITTREIVYKTIGDVELKLYLYEPTAKAAHPRPAIVFFFGGGWVGGSPSQFFPQCEHLAQKGIVAISAEYRVRNRHQTTPFECVKDGKSAIRWVRAHAGELGVDPRRIAAAGGSAGGHVAACTATIPNLENEGEDLSISSIPNLLVLFNPVLDTSKLGYGNDKLKDQWQRLSPASHVKPGICPTIIFHGIADKTVPIENPRRFDRLMYENGNHCELIQYEGQGHGFFNKGRGGDVYYHRTLAEMSDFLAGRGWLAFDNPLDPDAIQQRINRYRTTDVTLTLTDSQGQPLPDTDVTIEMTRHQFLFGCNAFALTLDAESDYNRRYADLFNFATLPFYWATYEPRPGQPNTAKLNAMANWCKNHRIITKGHPLTWHQTMPRWANALPLDEFQTTQMNRITREVSAYAGLIDTWDVINEVAATPNYQRDENNLSKLCNKIGQDPLVAAVFAAARQAGPNAHLIINDFNTSEQCVNIAERALNTTVPIDIIGIQSHMHTGYWGLTKAWDVCDRFARLNKPLHFTELTILSGEIKKNPKWNEPNPDWNTTPEGEAQQARQVEEFYRLLYSHPSVQAITWWDLADHRAWMQAPGGLLRRDLSPKPAYETLQRLIKQDWWTPTRTLKTDDNGQITFKATPGDYLLKSAAINTPFNLNHAGKLSLTVSLK